MHHTAGSEHRAEVWECSTSTQLLGANITLLHQVQEASFSTAYRPLHVLCIINQYISKSFIQTKIFCFEYLEESPAVNGSHHRSLESEWVTSLSPFLFLQYFSRDVIAQPVCLGLASCPGLLLELAGLQPAASDNITASGCLRVKELLHKQ